MMDRQWKLGGIRCWLGLSGVLKGMRYERIGVLRVWW